MKPLIQLTILYVLGVAIGNYIDIPFLFIYILMVLLFILSLILFIKKLLILTNIFLLFCILLTGILFHELHSRFLYSNSLIKYLNHEVVLIGDITTPPEVSKNKISLIILANKLITNKVEQKVNGFVLINIKNKLIDIASFRYGDRIKLIGKLKKPSELRNPGGFDYQKYLLRKKVIAIVWIEGDIVKLGSGRANPIFTIAYNLRDKISDVISYTLPDEPFACASFLEGVLLGKRSMLPEEIRGWFEDTGTIHILAISGLHVGLIGLIFFFIFHKFARLPQKTSYVFTFLTLIIFAIMTGARPSVIRATIMAGTIIIGMIIDRDTDIYNSLALAGLIILLQNPLTLFDIGFQLSFLATFSLFYLTPLIEPKIWFLPRYLAKLISASIAIQIGTSPLIIFYFHKLPLVTILSNIIVIPLLGIILVLGLAMFFIGIIFMLVANLIGMINFYAIAALLTSVSFFANFPYAYIYLPAISIPFMSSYYICIWMISKHKKIGTPKVIIGVLVLINIFLWVEVIKTSSNIMKVTFLDVGQGDAIFLEFPKGGNMLIDGGPGGYSDAGKRIILPFLRSKGINKLDVVIITHHHFDHYGGLLSLLKNYKIKKFVIDNGVEKQQLSEIIKERNILHKVVKAGDEIVGYPKTKIYILHPSNIKDKKPSNNNSIVVKVVYNKISFLFTGDIESKVARRLLPFKDMLSATILKVPHHGSKDGYYPNFIELVNPQIGIIEVGRNNIFNLPDKQVLMNYKRRDTIIYRTDKHGAVIVSTNGEKIWVKTMIK
jgi:competence protein ComEC